MSMFDALRISATGLGAERTRMDVAAENLANANSTSGPNGAYRRKEVALRAGEGTSFADTLSNVGRNVPGASSGSTSRGVRVAGVVESQTPNRLIYDPGHPDANPEGYVEMPNVNPVIEMTDLISASRAYEANVTAMQTSKSMFGRVLDLLR